MTEQRPRLREQVYRGVGWSVVQIWGSRVITFVIFLVLARLLGPSAYGVVTAAYVIVSAVEGLVDLGVADALVRRKDATDLHYDSAFWVILGVSFVLYGTLAALAPLLGSLFRQETLPQLLWILGATIPLAALSRIQEARLRAMLAFKPLAVRTLISTLLGGIVGIGMAVAGFGYWSLLAKGVTETTTAVALLWRSSSYRPSRRFDRAHWTELFAVGRPLLGSRVIDLINQRLDSLVVSNRLGPAALGLYAAASRVHQTLMETLFASINRVTLPAFAKLQDDPRRMGRALLRVTALASFFTFPAFALMGTLSERLVIHFFGASWAGSAPILSAFCVGGVLFGVSHFNAPLMTAKGRTDYVFVLMVANTTVNVIAILIGVQWGAVGVALGWALRGYIVLPLNLHLLKRTIGLPYGRYLRNLLPSLIVTAAVAVGVLAVQAYVWSRSDNVWQTLGLLGGAIFSYLAAMLLLCPTRTALVAKELEALLPRLPKVSHHIERYRSRVSRHDNSEPDPWS